MIQLEKRVAPQRRADLQRVAGVITRFVARGNQVTPEYVLHHLKYAYQIGYRDGAFPEILKQEETV